MNKISKYHSSIKVKSKNIKSNVVKDYICCLPELQIISCRRQHLKQDFPKRFLAFRLPPKNIHLRSDDHTKRRGGIHIQPLQPFIKILIWFIFSVANIRIKPIPSKFFRIFFSFYSLKSNFLFNFASEMSAKRGWSTYWLLLFTFVTPCKVVCHACFFLYIL